jgi:hypothetical protein
VKTFDVVVALLLTVVCSVSDASVLTEEYDPLRKANAFDPALEDLEIRDDSRRREIPIRIYLPQTKQAAPVILFSHGLGGSRRACGYLGEHWSARGYVVVFLQHPGSDESVWKDLPVRQRPAALKNAPSFQSTLARFKDVPAVLDQPVKWNEETDHPLAGTRVSLMRNWQQKTSRLWSTSHNQRIHVSGGASVAPMSPQVLGGPWATSTGPWPTRLRPSVSIQPTPLPLTTVEPPC